MQRFILIVFLIILKGFFAHAQEGKQFPELVGETLDDKKIIIPINTFGKFTLIGLAYSKKAEDDLMSWISPVYTNFIEKPKPGLFNESYDVNIYFVPMFTGVNQAAAGAAKKKMKEGVDPKLFPHCILYKGELNKYQNDLRLDKKDIPYFFVLDKQGKIIYTTSGSYTDSKMAQIEGLLEE